MRNGFSFENHDSWNAEIGNWLVENNPEFRRIGTPERYSLMSYDQEVVFLLMHFKTVEGYLKEGDRWIEIGVVSDFMPLKGRYNERQREKIRDYGIYRSAQYAFEELGLDGAYGLIRSDDIAVHHITDHINNGTKVAIDKIYRPTNTPFHHWRFTKEEYHSGPVKKRAEAASREF